MNPKTLQIVIKAQDDASKVLDKVGDSTENVSRKVAGAAGAMAKTAALAAAAALATGLTLSTKAAWDQVGAVQQATVALGAYEKDAGKVNRTLSDLVKYARSDMGVLFQRQDLFAAAQGLKIMGDNTDSLVDHVKIMSRSVGLGLSTFEGLGNVIQRVGSTGKLYADDLQFLQNAGFKLDGSLSGTTQTFESLFAVLDKGIPVEAMAGQSETIAGKMVKLQTAFRDVGLRILGVDRDTSKFIEGGLGARMVLAIESTTNALRTIAPAVESIVSGFLSATTWIGQNQIVLAVFAGVLGAFAALVGSVVIPAFFLWAGAARAAAIATLAATWPILAVGAAVGALAYLIISNWDTIKNVTSTVFTTIFNFISDKITWFRENWASAIGFVIGFFATLPFKLPVYVYQAISSIIGFVMGINWSSVFSGIGTAFSRIMGNLWDWAQDTFRKIVGINWGDVFSKAAKGIGNSILNLIEGAINGALAGIPGSPKVDIPGFADGVRNFGGGMAVVGERGPELVNLPKGSDVFSNRESMSMGGGGTTINISGTINIQTPEAATAFWDRVDQTARLSRMGMA